MQLFSRMISILLVACAAASPALAETMTLTGEVTYRERIALPANAVLRVRLMDTETADGPVPIEARAAIAPGGQVPLTFTLRFDDRVIEPGHAYALTAEITSGNVIWFRNIEPYAVNPLLPDDPVIIVTDFTGATTEDSGPPIVTDLPSATPILDVTWRAESIGGNPLLPHSEATLSIAGDMRAGGRGGCNSYFAQAEIAGESLRFSAVAATRMACASADITQQEQNFFAALQSTRFWRLRNGRLVLLDAGGRDTVVLVQSAR